MLNKTKTKKKPVKKTPKKKVKYTKPKTGSRAKIFTFKDLNKMDQKLTLKQHSFCIAYLNNYGQSAQAIIDAGYDVYKRDRDGNVTDYVNTNLVRSIASENLQKPNILAFIRMKYEDFGYNDENVEMQHLFLINQNDNLPTKQRAITDYFKIKGKFAPEEKTVKHELTDELLDRILRDD